MTRVDFYHLQKQTLEQVLPKLLEKAYSTGKNIKIKVGNEMRVEFINSHLWTFDDTSFIPHGSKKDGFARTAADLAKLRQRQPQPRRPPFFGRRSRRQRR